jgi:hypothetical protein
MPTITRDKVLNASLIQTSFFKVLFSFTKLLPPIWQEAQFLTNNSSPFVISPPRAGRGAMIHDADKMNAPAQIFVWATIILSIMEDFEECQGFPKAVTSLQQMSKI